MAQLSLVVINLMMQRNITGGNTKKFSLTKKFGCSYGLWLLQKLRKVIRNE